MSSCKGLPLPLWWDMCRKYIEYALKTCTRSPIKFPNPSCKLVLPLAEDTQTTIEFVGEHYSAVECF